MGNIRVLITGIDGFVGSHAAEFLLGMPGVEIHGTVIEGGPSQNIDHIRQSLHLHPLDILDGSGVLDLVDDLAPDRIIHLAGQAFVPNALRDPVLTFQTNIFGGINFLEAVRRQVNQGKPGPSILIVSTGEVYGKTNSHQPIVEDSVLAPANPYAASKASIDLIAQQYVKTFGVNAVIARPFNHVGPRQSPVFVCSDFARQFARIAIGSQQPKLSVGNVEAARDFTDVRDVVRAYWFLFDRSTPEFIFNVCSGRSVKIIEIIRILEGISGVQVEIETNQDRLRPHDVPEVVGSLERLRRATGWSPSIPLSRTLREVYTYWHDLETKKDQTRLPGS